MAAELVKVEGTDSLFPFNFLIRLRTYAWLYKNFMMFCADSIILDSKFRPCPQDLNRYNGQHMESKTMWGDSPLTSY
jgi:hypothetical protein